MPELTRSALEAAGEIVGGLDPDAQATTPDQCKTEDTAAKLLSSVMLMHADVQGLLGTPPFHL